MDRTQWEELRTWYREALSRRASSLEALLPPVAGESPDPDALDRVEAIAHALRGSGGTFGFPIVSEAARILSADTRDRLLPKLLGLIDLLRDVAGGGDGRTADRAGGWFTFASSHGPGVGRAPEEIAGDTRLGEAWSRMATAVGLTQSELSLRIATRLGIGVADPDTAQRFASLLVPPALAIECRLLPLAEDGSQITVASANPTDVAAMATLERATGRVARIDVIAPEALDPILLRRYGEPTKGRILDDVVPSPEPDRGSFRGKAPDGASVLVVDDEPGERLLCRTILEREGFRVMEAEGGLEALAALAGGASIDLALVDVLMPGMPGRELVRALREDPISAGLPVIVLTGLQSGGAETELMELGADDYLRKPVDPPILIARIRAILRRVRTFQTP
jgi:CheY-like chemotaxis protein